MSVEIGIAELIQPPIASAGIVDGSVLSSVISHIPYVIFWKDRECRYLGCNVQFAKLAGLASPNDIVGLSDFDLPWDHDEAVAYRDDDMEVMDTNTPKLHIVETQVNAEGIKSFLDTSKAPLRNHSGEVIGIICIYVDVTEKRAMAAKLAQSSKLESIGQLAAGIAHEINTPAQFVGDNVRFTADCFADLMGFVNKAKALAAAVAHGDACSELAAEVLKDVEVAEIDFIEQEMPITFSQTLDGIERIRQIVASMKEYSHCSNERAGPLDINRLIRNVVTVSTSEWRYIAEIEMKLEDLPPVHGIHEHISQTMLDLIVNAAHAIAERQENTGGEKALGKISVSSSFTGNSVKINIKDNGTGIPAALQTKIFDPFFSTKKVGKGNGQGLAVAHNLIVKGHGGTISFETESGVGTTFTIGLPIEGLAA